MYLGIAIGLGIAALAVLIPAAFVWYLNVGGIYQMVKSVRQRGKETPTIVCALDADCPPGYACVNGHCVPAKA